MRLLYFIFIFSHLSLNAQEGRIGKTISNIKKIKYDKVLIFNYNYDSIQNKKTFQEFKPLTPATISSVKKCSVKHLTKQQTEKIVKIFTDTSTYGQNYADCFEPRHCFAFYNSDQLVFVVEICFDCGFLESSIPIKAAYERYYDIEDLEDEKGKKYSYRRYLKGFSENGRKNLIGICKELNMLYCPDPE